MNVVLPVRTISTAHFAGAIAAAGAAATAHLKTKGNDATNGVVPEGLAAGTVVRSRLKSIRILSVQLLPWEVQLFRSATGIGGAVIDTESFVGLWSFPGSGSPGDGSRATGDTFYQYYIDGLDVPYEDADKSSQIHVRLINRHAATAKIAGASGAVVIEFGFEISSGRP
jgi:hypothetical protein